MKIIVDAMGGDNAPEEIVKGAVQAARARAGLEIVLVGREDEVRSAAAQCGGLPGTGTGCRRQCVLSTPRRLSTCTTTLPRPSRSRRIPP